MTKLWREGVSIRVATDDGEDPKATEWRGERHRVGVNCNRWRVRHGWWADGPEAFRAYYKLALVSGELVIIFHDLILDEWKRQRLYD